MALEVKKAKLLYRDWAEGLDWYLAEIEGDAAPVSLTITGADVEGMNGDDRLAAGSTIYTPEGSYIALEDGVFSAMGGDGSSEYYVVSYSDGVLGSTWKEISDALTEYGVGKVIIAPDIDNSRYPALTVSSATVDHGCYVSVYDVQGNENDDFYCSDEDDYPEYE